MCTNLTPPTPPAGNHAIHEQPFLSIALRSYRPAAEHINESILKAPSLSVRHPSVRHVFSKGQ